MVLSSCQPSSVYCQPVRGRWIKPLFLDFIYAPPSLETSSFMTHLAQSPKIFMFTTDHTYIVMLAVNTIVKQESVISNSALPHRQARAGSRSFHVNT